MFKWTTSRAANSFRLPGYVLGRGRLLPGRTGRGYRRGFPLGLPFAIDGEPAAGLALKSTLLQPLDRGVEQNLVLVFPEQEVRGTGDTNVNLLGHRDQVIVESRNLDWRHGLVQIAIDQKCGRYYLRRLHFVPGIPERIAIKRWRSSDAARPPCAAGGIEG